MGTGSPISPLRSYPSPWRRAPNGIPDELRDAFSMGGRVEIIMDRFVDSTLPSECREPISDEHLQGFLYHNLHALPVAVEHRVADILAEFQPNMHSQVRRAFERSGPAEAYHFREGSPLHPLLDGVDLGGKRVAVIEEKDLFL